MGELLPLVSILATIMADEPREVHQIERQKPKASISKKERDRRKKKKKIAKRSRR